MWQRHRLRGEGGRACLQVRGRAQARHPQLVRGAALQQPPRAIGALRALPSQLSCPSARPGVLPLRLQHCCCCC
eukprot:scaffold211_cov447-Prasinococcus_capsulatus_cf.AAC.5